MSTVTVHLGLVPYVPYEWTAEPLDGIVTCEAPYPHYTGTSFKSWGEPLEHGEPHEVTFDLEVVPESGHHGCIGTKCVSRAELERLADEARQLLEPLVPDGWRLVDYVVITDAQDHSDGARTVGMWGA